MKKIEEFLELPEKKALIYNFASEGEEADNSALANEVYNKLFPVFKREDFGELRGDTAITWRTVIMRNYYKSAYCNLNEERDEIKSILKKYAQFDGPVEFNDKYGVLKVTNHYTLGNFVLCPRRHGINPKRANSLNDYYDKFLLVLKEFYSIIDNNRDLEMFAEDNSLNKAIVEQRKYFEYFKDFNGFVDENLLQDFTDGYDNQGNYNIKNLSDAENFEDYVKASVSVINARSKRMWDKLQENNSK